MTDVRPSHNSGTRDQLALGFDGLDLYCLEGLQKVWKEVFSIDRLPQETIASYKKMSMTTLGNQPVISDHPSFENSTGHLPSLTSSSTTPSLQFSIFLGEAIQALGELLNIKWVNDGKVEIGAFCTTQGTSRFGWFEQFELQFTFNPRSD